VLLAVRVFLVLLVVVVDSVTRAAFLFRDPGCGCRIGISCSELFFPATFEMYCAAETF
jgi:hypothetical protein